MERSTRSERDALRRVYFDTWQKLKHGTPLEPLQQLLATIIGMHPEYHEILDHPSHAETAEFPPGSPAANPFLHMGMHVALLEQVQADQPRGVRDVRVALREQLDDAHRAEHQMMNILEQTLVQTQTTGDPPDPDVYLRRLWQLVKHG